VARELKLSEPLEADVVDLAHDGRGVARIAGKAVFIEGALPGERVRLRIEKRRRQFDEARLEEIITASPDRVTPRCIHFGICGGCSLQHLAPDAQLAAKQRQLIDNLERIGRVKAERILAPIRGAPFAYRRRARLGVKYVHKKGRVLAGFRERNKPYLADLQRCEILIDRFATLPRDLAALVESLSIRERVPQVEVAAGDEAAALVFRVMEAPSPADLEALARFGRDQGVQIYLQPGGLDTIRPLEGTVALEGAPPLGGAPPLEGVPPPLAYSVDAGRVRLEFGPSDFIQVNGEVNRALVDRALELLNPSSRDRVLDLFCGLGNFTLPLARRAGSVVGVEGDEALVRKARENAHRNQVGNAEFHRDDLFEPGSLGRWAEGTYDLVLLDPPRAGALQIMERMPQWRPRRVVYISCHPGSLARDAGILVEGQGFRLVGSGVMDMFPHTTHVESVAVFERQA
jgi:23S rRNA (uracil1939-C5)-methyltransferase